MENELISILIPCYNTKKYLAKCLDSVISQTYSNLEIIVLSDGSTDGSLDIMKEYSQKDSRIRVIDRENKGVAASRNELIKSAKAQYIMFVDSDDYISKYMVENLYEMLKETNSDIAMCKVEKVFEDTKKEDILEEPVIYNEYDRLQTIFNLISIGDFYDFPVAKLFNKKVFNNVEFPLNRVYEDSATVFKLYDNLDKIVVLENRFYNYLIGRENSITTKKYVYKNLYDNYLAIKERYDYLSSNVKELKNEIKMGYIRNILTLLERAYLSDNEELIQSDIVLNYLTLLKDLYNSIDDFKNRPSILNNYKLACLYLLMNNKINEYVDIIKMINN